MNKFDVYTPEKRPKICEQSPGVKRVNFPANDQVTTVNIKQIKQSQHDTYYGIY